MQKNIYVGLYSVVFPKRGKGLTPYDSAYAKPVAYAFSIHDYILRCAEEFWALGARVEYVGEIYQTEDEYEVMALENSGLDIVIGFFEHVLNLDDEACSKSLLAS